MRALTIALLACLPLPALAGPMMVPDQSATSPDGHRLLRYVANDGVLILLHRERSGATPIEVARWRPGVLPEGLWVTNTGVSAVRLTTVGGDCGPTGLLIVRYDARGEELDRIHSDVWFGAGTRDERWSYRLEHHVRRADWIDMAMRWSPDGPGSGPARRATVTYDLAHGTAEVIDRRATRQHPHPVEPMAAIMPQVVDPEPGPALPDRSTVVWYALAAAVGAVVLWLAGGAR